MNKGLAAKFAAFFLFPCLGLKLLTLVRQALAYEVKVNRFNKAGIPSKKTI